MENVKVNISVKGTEIFGVADPPLTSGTVGRKAKFTFDETWNELSKVAVFNSGNIYLDGVIDENGECEIPWEILTHNSIGLPVQVGVRGVKGSEVVIPTIYATVGTLLKGTSLSDNVSNPKTPDLLDQIMATIEELKNNGGVKYIRESVEAHTLEDGIYIIEGNNGGDLSFISDVCQAININFFTYGLVIVTASVTGKQITVFSTDEVSWLPLSFAVILDEEGNMVDNSIKIYADQAYVDEQIAPLKNANGIKVITEEINAGVLDYGIYYIDGNNGGCVNVPDDHYFIDGTIFVSPSADLSGKQVTICGISTDYLPIIASYVYDEDGNYMDIYDEFVSKTYVDASVRVLQKQIDELKNTPTIRTEIELNNKGDLVYSWYRDATTKGDVTKTNDGWSIVGYSKSVSGGMAYTHFAIVGKTQQSVITNATQTESGTLTYNGIVYYYTVKKIVTQYVTDYGKAEQLEETFTDNNTLATKVLDYYYGVA